MALERDNQNIEAVKALTPISLCESADVVTDAVDTKQMRSIAFAFMLSAPLDPGDEVYLGAEDSKDGITWNTTSIYKLLPSEKQSGGMTLVIPINGYIQTMGVVSAERYVRVTIQPDVLKGTPTIYVIAIMHPEDLAFRTWDPDAVSDGKP